MTGSVIASQPMGVLSPKQVGQIARLLDQYKQDDNSAHNPPVDELLTYLRDIQPGSV